MEPVYLSSVTVGRKFSEATCKRALCCRLQGFTPGKVTGLPVGYGVRHPAMLGTSVKLDHGRYQEGTGASFENPVSMVWSAQCEDTVHRLDGRTGMEWQTGEASPVSAAAMRVEADHVAAAIGMSLAQASLSRASYATAKSMLTAHVARFVDSVHHL